LVLRTNESWQDFRVDWVPVQVTYSGQCDEKHERPPWWEGDIKPPGLVECHQLLQFGDFEGNYDRVFSYWHAGEAGAYQRQSRYRYDGAYSLRLHASLGSYPVCTALSPYLYQTVQIPSDVYTMTTMHVRGKWLVADSESSCCRDTTDADDLLYLQVKNSSGDDLYESVIANGGVVSETWGGFEENVTDDVGPFAHREDELQVHFYATHDGDIDCTFFYLDALQCEVCTGWPVPDDVVGTASLGGLVEVLVQGIPGTRFGVDVWAYSQGGEVYHTYTIQDGTYHFYNIPPGTYTIYAEYWEAGGVLHYGTRTVTVAENERNYSVDLWLP
jgi:hypothetical protein